MHDIDTNVGVEEVRKEKLKEEQQTKTARTINPLITGVLFKDHFL